jgi:Tol biopolymer transport system component
MRLLRRSELRGYLIISLVVIGLAVTLLALTGKLQKRLGINISFGGTYDKIAFVSDRNGAPDIWVMDADGSNQRPLTNDEAVDSQPTWAPNGKRILFVSDRSADNAQIFVVGPEGRGLRQVTSSTGAKSTPSFSPDGFSIAYLTGGRVFAVDLTGGHEQAILPTAEQSQAMEMLGVKQPYRYITWASDSTTMAAIQEAEGLQVAQIVPEPGAGPAIVTSLDNRPLAAEKVSVAWSKQGHKLAVALATMENLHLLAIRDFDNDLLQNVLRMNGEIGPDSPDWSPDERFLAVGLVKMSEQARSKPAGIVIVDVRGDEVVQVAEGEAYEPRCSPDGSSILYTMKKDGKTDIWKYDLAAKQSINLTKGKGNNYNPAWGPSRSRADAKRIGLSRPSTDSIYWKQA